jgi:hypothetical protein
VSDLSNLSSSKADLLPKDPPIRQAIEDLGIDVPILRLDINPDGSLTFHLYGRSEPVTWRPLGHGGAAGGPPPSPKLGQPAGGSPDPPSPKAQDLTVVFGIGRKTAQVLQEDGITTYQQLADAYASGQLNFHSTTLNKIEAWLEANGYLRKETHP